MSLKKCSGSGSAALFLLLCCLIPAPSIKGEASEKKIVLAQVQKFFDALAARSPDAARSVVLAEGCSFSVRDENGQTILRNSSLKESMEGLASVRDDLLERMWDPTVFIHERIAMVWTPYDFHRNREFSHCGVDVFTLIKTEQGWRIASIVYTVEKTGCQESPLGPVQKVES